MLAFFTLLIIVSGLQSNRIRPRCYSDFDFHKISNHSKSIYEKSWKRDCTEHVRAICTKNITIAYYEMEPYTTKQIFTETRWPEKGILQQILSIALAQCCGSCIKINFNRVDSRDTLVDIETKQGNDILFPVFSQGQPHHLNASLPSLTSPIIHIPGAMFITKSVLSATIFAKEVLQSVIDIWPLFGVSILLAFTAGVFCWIMDTWWNKEHFPRTFFAGSFEGFWWAFVSMTTVGYGDRSPKSIPGRLFACFWILCGITIMALMTAALTTAITAVALRQQPSMNHGTVGLLKDHVFEKNMLIRGNAKKVFKSTVEELLECLHNNEVDAMLVDSLTAKSNFKTSILKDNGLYLDKVIQDFDQSFLGITIYDDELHSLINEYFEFQRDAINDFLFDIIHTFNDIRNDKVIANLIFTSDSGLFYPTIYTCIVILSIALAIGITYEIYRYVKKQKSKSKQTEFKVTMKSLKNEESKFQEELEELIKRWERHLLDIMRGYSIRGVFSKTNRTYANIMIKLTPTDLDVLAIPNDDEFEHKAMSKKKKKKATKKSGKSSTNGHVPKSKTKYSAFENVDDDETEEDETEEEEEEEEEEVKVKTKRKTIPKKVGLRKKKKTKRSQITPENQSDEDEKPRRRTKKKTLKSEDDESQYNIELETEKKSKSKEKEEV